MGHANRPWLHHALGLDAQSRRLRLSSARRWCESDTYTNGVGQSYTDSDSYGNSNSHGDCHSYRNSDTNPRTQDYTVAETTSDAAAAAIARSWQQLLISCGSGEWVPKPQLCPPLLLVGYKLLISADLPRGGVFRFHQQC